jgi:hypothetical protein
MLARDEREAEIAESEAHDRDMLASGIEKIARKYERLHPTWKVRQDENILMKLTIGELRVLKQFHTKHHDG